MKAIRSLPLDFVISYNQENAVQANETLLALEREGLQGWVDEHYEPFSTISIEGQVAMAWEKARFVIALMPDGYRYSAWCRSELGQALAAEGALPLTQLLILHGSDAQIPEGLRSHPRFRLDGPSGIPDLARHIRDRRQCTLARRDPQLAIHRWQSSSEQLRHLLPSINSQLGAQLEAVDMVCSWLAAHESGLPGDSVEQVTLTSITPNGRRALPVPRERMLHASFSDALEVDCVPFQRLLYDAVLVELRDASRLPGDVREAIQRVIWDQLPMLTCATNRFFQGQMLEVADEIAAEADFALLDEAVNNHFLAMTYGRTWDWSIERAIDKRPGGRLPAPPASGRWASAVEHVALSNWQRSRSQAGRLTASLADAERVSLASRGCLKTFDGFASSEPPRELSSRAMALGLGQHGSVAAIQPNLAVERFYWSLTEFLSQTAWFAFTPEHMECLRQRMPPFTQDVLEALQQALEQIAARYADALECWRQRRGRSVTFTSELILGCMDHLIRPYTVLHLAGVRTPALRARMERLLQYISAHSNPQSKALAEEVASQLDHPEQLETTNFQALMAEILHDEKPH